MKTVSQIAKMHDIDRHRVVWAIKSRGIEPTKRFGSTAVYDTVSLAEIESALQAIRAKRGGGVG